MRHSLLPITALSLLLVAAAAPSAGAASLPFQGTLAIQISTLDPIALLGSGVAEVSEGGHLTQMELGAPLFRAAGILW